MNLQLQTVSFLNFISESSFLKSERLTESAWMQHVPFAFWLVEQLKPKLFVELGVHTGVSYFAFCQSVKANKLSTLCYGIDTWQGDAHAGLYDEAIWADVSTYNANAYAAFSYLLKTPFNESLPYFEAASIDLLHIDGYHTYEAVKEDFENWLPKMSANGVVLFHDIVVRERAFGVCKFWNELKQQYKTFEFLHGHGLGVLALGAPAAESIGQLVSLVDDAAISAVRTVYANLGARHTEGYNTTVLHNLIVQANAQLTALHAQYEQLKTEHDALAIEHEVLKKFVTAEQATQTPIAEPLAP